MIKKLTIICCAIWILCLADGTQAAEDELLLFGFEKDELQKVAASFKKAKKPFTVLENGALRLQTQQSCQNKAANAGVCPMDILPKEVTQGTYALKIPSAKSSGGYFYYLPKIEQLGLASDPRSNIRLPEVFNTTNWFDSVFPKDWSAYDLLRVDVKVVHDRPVAFMMELEDDLVEPPVSMTYKEVKPGSWVTLEFDLHKAVTERGLDLTKLKNIFIRFDGRKDLKELGTRKAARERLTNMRVYLDNIRLSRKAAGCANPVVKGERSTYTLEIPRSFGVDLAWEFKSGGMVMGVTAAKAPMPKPAKLDAITDKIEGGEPKIIEMLPFFKKSFSESKHTKAKNISAELLYKRVILRTIVAADSKAMMLCFGVRSSGRFMKFDKPKTVNFGSVSAPIVAVVTADGGNSWGGFAGPDTVPTWLHKGRKRWEGTVFDGGADLMGLHDDGCLTFRSVYEWYPGDRVFFWRTVFTGEKWVETSRYFVTGDPRFCMHAAQNILQLASGRIWGMGSSRNRDGQTQSWAKYSDNDGATWNSWRGQGRVSTIPMWGAVRGHLFPYGKHVGMIARKGKFIYYDGHTWIEASNTPIKYPARIVSNADRIYVNDEKGALFHYDGKTWAPLSLPGRQVFPRFLRIHGNSPGEKEAVVRQYFTVCGDTTLFVEVDKTGKQILCWKKKKGMEWTGPQILVTEETPIADFVAPRYGRLGFTPIAWNCWSDDKKQSAPIKSNLIRELKTWVKVLQVPAQ